MGISWEAALCVSLAMLAWTVLWRAGRAWKLVALLGVAAYLGLVGAFWEPARPSFAERVTPQRIEDQGYVSSDTCQSCHPSQYASWHRSYHRTMTQVVGSETLAAPLEAVSLQANGRRFRAEVRNGELWVDDVDGAALRRHRESGSQADIDTLPRLQGPVVLSTGSHHMQIYWVRNEQGRFHQVSWVWLIKDRRWVPTEDVYLQPPDDVFGLDAEWGQFCIKCHATGGQPRLRLASRSLLSRTPEADTKVGELGIACEACHGPASEHVALNRNPARRYLHHLSDRDDPTIVNPKTLPAKRGSEVCGRCHAVHQQRAWNENTGTPFRAGDPLRKYFRLIRFEDMPEDSRGVFFWEDGTARVTGREYTAMAQSACFKSGDISCTSCHSMHESDPNDQVGAGKDGDGACLDCHANLATQVAEHTHHAPESDGARCYNCHMSNTTYGLLGMTRSHRIDSPSAEVSLETGRPNSCNLCHIDRSLLWTSEWLTRWYDQPELELSRDERELPAAVLWLLRGDAMQRTTAAWHLGWEPALVAGGEDWQAPLLSRSLDDPYTSVRYVADRSLRMLPGYAEFQSDFLAPPEQRGEAVQAALALWRESAALGPRFSADRVDRIRSQRDDRPVRIFE